MQVYKIPDTEALFFFELNDLSYVQAVPSLHDISQRQQDKVQTACTPSALSQLARKSQSHFDNTSNKYYDHESLSLGIPGPLRASLAKVLTRKDPAPL